MFSYIAKKVNLLLCVGKYQKTYVELNLHAFVIYLGIRWRLIGQLHALTALPTRPKLPVTVR
jgi:hypothetical protein